MNLPVMQISYTGCPEAELFTLEVRESLAGVLGTNYVDDPARGGPGFVFASVEDRPWHDTMWTRDTGVFLREMAHWGYREQAIRTIQCLFRHVVPNAEGFYTFPAHLKPGQPATGSELDGTSAIIIGAILVHERLPADHPARRDIWAHLAGPASPTRSLLKTLSSAMLVAGSGEFGGGCTIQGEFYNVVQNGLVRLALLAVSRAAAAQGDSVLAEQCRGAAAGVLQAMLSRLRQPDGSWLWCRRAPDYAIDRQILDHEWNKGFGGINGVLSMSADVLGFQPITKPSAWLQACILTFLRLLSEPLRMRQFSNYGIWTQFDLLFEGLITSAYGFGHAIQCMLLLDQPELYSKAVNWLARATYEPLPGQDLHRTSRYHFYERYYSPDAVGRFTLEEGCGALNLLSAMEPLKIARLILGMDDSDPACVRIIPRLPRGWTDMEARGVPVFNGGATATVDFSVHATDDGVVRHVEFQASRPIARLAVRLGSARDPAWRRQRNVVTLRSRLGKG